MKVIKAINRKTKQPQIVVDCFVDKGYLQGPGGSLPDVDTDFQSDRRQEVKEYIERRYNHDGKQRVFSAGTYSTLKIKAVIKDVARTMKLPPSLVNYMTAIIDDPESDYTEFFKQAYKSKKLNKFIQEYPRLFEDIRTLMFQPRSTSIHASALLVTPDKVNGEDVECFDITPIKKVNGILVSEFDGYELDACGLLKNDCLATKELSKLQQTINLCNQEYGADLSLEKIAFSDLDEERVYELLSQGFTQNVFQLSSGGMTKFIKEMQPSCINDIIAANALYRPATLENGSTTDYVDCKRGDREPVYLWGTYNALKNTFGSIVYQEQIVQIAREVGGFSLADGVHLVKYVSKKKVDKIQAMKSQFMRGAHDNGCPHEDADAIWKSIESAGLYCFNASHATAYAITAYAGAYLKAKYPTAFYTVALQWAEEDEIIPLMSEMEACSNAKVVPPDINKSRIDFFTDFTTDEIFWSLSKIKMLGVKAVDWIVTERNKNGEFSGLDNFIDRVFKYKLKKYEYWDDPDNEDEIQRCPVNARHIRNLIVAGCFDKVERIFSVGERYSLIQKAASKLGFELSPSEFPEDLVLKHYFWSQQQIKVSGLGAIDYKRIFDNFEHKSSCKGFPYRTVPQVYDEDESNKRCAVCVSVGDINTKQFKSSKTGKTESFVILTLQQNNDTIDCIAWPEEREKFVEEIQNCKGRMVILTGLVKYSEFTKKNNLQLTKTSKFYLL